MIEVLISSFNNGIIKVPSVLIDPRPDVKYLIIHQFTNSKFFGIPQELQRPDVTLHYFESVGLSKSRNLAIQKATGDIVLIADDDVKYCNEYFDRIKEIYDNSPKLDVACFKIKSSDTPFEYKKYGNQIHDLSVSLPHYISSIEITFKLESVKSKKIEFDIRFGLGSKFLPGGEEKIFLTDCLKHKLNIFYFPDYIVEHPYISSGKVRNKYSKKFGHIYGASYYRIYGIKGFFRMLNDYKYERKKISTKLLIFHFHLITGFTYSIFSRN